MNEKEIIKWVEQGREQGFTTLPTRAMKAWLKAQGLRIVVELGTGKANVQR